MIHWSYSTKRPWYTGSVAHTQRMSKVTRRKGLRPNDPRLIQAVWRGKRVAAHNPLQNCPQRVCQTIHKPIYPAPRRQEEELRTIRSTSAHRSHASAHLVRIILKAQCLGHNIERAPLHLIVNPAQILADYTQKDQLDTTKK